jgi:hypothetical protein
VEDAELSQDCAAIVIDSFARQTISGVERIYGTKWDFDAPAGRGKAAPLAKVRASNDHFEEDSVVCDVAALYVDFYVWQRFHELLVKPANPACAVIVFAPGLIIVSPEVAEGAEDALKIVLVLEADVLLNDCDSS